MHEDEKTVRALVRARPLLRRAVVRVVDGPDRGKQVELVPNQAVSVGTSLDNQLQLRDMTVSRYHLELTLQRGEILVRDLDSMNGTYIGDVRIDRALVPPGTKLMIGGAAVMLEPDAGSIPPPLPKQEEETPEIPGLIAQGPAMREVARSIARLARSNVTVLLHGETGTGKEVLARAVHELSDRKDQPFEVVDCGSMAPTLIASELFGHERGAFTGAHAERAGAFERAHGGTVFLDEIGELPLDLQPMLLGVLERRRFKRVGGAKERSIDVRVVAATHRDLRNATNLGTFRADLYFRLAVARVVIPPLRERPDDIEALVRHFAEQLTGDPNAQPFDRATMEALESHPWSGNVRELRNVVESAIAIGSVVLEGQHVGVADGSQPLTAEGGVISVAGGEGGSPPGFDQPYRDARARAINDFERAYLSWLIQACGGNASEAARRARMDRPYLLGLLRKHGLR
jgi:DNA-binding NtrC family response regulator